MYCDTCKHWSRRNATSGTCELIDTFPSTSNPATSIQVNAYADDDSNLHIAVVTGSEFYCAGYVDKSA